MHSHGKPLAIDLYCGLGGWAEGLLSEGYERHDYGTGGYPGQLVLQDALTIHGSQFKIAKIPFALAQYIARVYKPAMHSFSGMSA